MPLFYHYSFVFAENFLLWQIRPQLFLFQGRRIPGKAVNDLRKEVVFADIKLDSSRINLKALKEKSSKLSEEYKGYKKEWLGLHIGNIREFIK